jgi:hypothetical protein
LRNRLKRTNDEAESKYETRVGNYMNQNPKTLGVVTTAHSSVKGVTAEHPQTDKADLAAAGRHGKRCELDAKMPKMC